MSDTADLTVTQRAILLGLVGLGVVAMTPIFPAPTEVALVLGFGLGWWRVPRFWSTVASGVVGGAVAGLLILGVGFRLAMRVVAIMDPGRVPGFNFGDTMFILIGVGAIFGGLIGVVANLVRRGLGLSATATTAILPAVGAFGLLLLGDDTRRELFELGGGAWVNIPMFGLVAILYGVGFARLTRRLEARGRAKRDVAEPMEMAT